MVYTANIFCLYLKTRQKLMKTLISLFALLFLFGSLFTSCSEDIDILGDFEETAVIYGLLDKSDSIHYIKINRAFIGPGNSLQIAQIPDSSYFKQVTATVTEYVNGTQTKQWVLKDTLVNNKETNGVFYAPTQKLYYFKTSSSSPLDANAIYKLNVSVNNGLFEVEGQTSIVSGLATSADNQSFRFDFADDPGSYAQKGIAITVGNSYVINTSLKVNFKEIITSSNDTTHSSYKWNLGESDVNPGGTKTFTVNGKQFYELMLANVTNNPAINRRRMHSVEVIVTGGSQDLYNYMTVNQPSSSLAQNKPTFTNLSATNNHRVIGIFSSRMTYKIEKFFINPSNSSLRMMTQKSVAELCTGPITGGLSFCSQHPGDLTTSYTCN